MELSGVKNISKTYGSGGAGKHALKSYLSLIPIPDNEDPGTKAG